MLLKTINSQSINQSVLGVSKRTQTEVHANQND